MTTYPLFGGQVAETAPPPRAEDGHLPISSRTRFAQLVLSGGGTRCFWQSGFLSKVRDEIKLRPRRIASVSGGALTACAFVAGVEEEVLRLTKVRFRHRRNFHLRAKYFGLFPHEETYRSVIKGAFDDLAIGKVIGGPPIEVVLTELPEGMPEWLSTTAGLVTYLIERAVKDSTDKSWTRRLGLRELRIDAREAAREGRLDELIATAARVPPFFGFDCWDHRPIIDGGSMSDAPLPTEEQGATLCLLASYFKNLPLSDDRIFVMPSRTIPTGKVDLTEAKEIEEAWKLGEEDGERFLEVWRKGAMDGSRALDLREI